MNMFKKMYFLCFGIICVIIAALILIGLIVWNNCSNTNNDTITAGITPETMAKSLAEERFGEEFFVVAISQSELHGQMYFLVCCENYDNTKAAYYIFYEEDNGTYNLSSSATREGFPANDLFKPLFK